jgi:hypothetical protein
VECESEVYRGWFKDPLGTRKTIVSVCDLYLDSFSVQIVLKFCGFDAEYRERISSSA